jgi:hypothetical protein
MLSFNIGRVVTGTASYLANGANIFSKTIVNKLALKGGKS